MWHYFLWQGPYKCDIICSDRAHIKVTLFSLTGPIQMWHYLLWQGPYKSDIIFSDRAHINVTCAWRSFQDGLSYNVTSKHTRRRTNRGAAQNVRLHLMWRRTWSCIKLCMIQIIQFVQNAARSSPGSRVWKHISCYMSVKKIWCAQNVVMSSAYRWVSGDYSWVVITGEWWLQVSGDYIWAVITSERWVQVCGDYRWVVITVEWWVQVSGDYRWVVSTGEWWVQVSVMMNLA